MGDKKYTVEKANRFIAENKHLVNTQYKPEEHFSAEIGWINDPNGFVYFRGEYHLFINSIHMIVFGGLCTGDMLKVRTW